MLALSVDVIDELNFSKSNKDNGVIIMYKNLYIAEMALRAAALLGRKL